MLSINFLEKFYKNYSNRTLIIQANIEICNVIKRILHKNNISFDEDISKIYSNVLLIPYFVEVKDDHIDNLIIIINVLNYLDNNMLPEECLHLISDTNYHSKLTESIKRMQSTYRMFDNDDNSYYFLLKLNDNFVKKGKNSVISDFVLELKKIHPEYVVCDEYLYDSWFQDIISLNDARIIKNSYYLLFEMKNILDNILNVRDEYYIECSPKSWDSDVVYDKFYREAFKNDKSLHLKLD